MNERFRVAADPPEEEGHLAHPGALGVAQAPMSVRARHAAGLAAGELVMHPAIDRAVAAVESNG